MTADLASSLSSALDKREELAREVALAPDATWYTVADLTTMTEATLVINSFDAPFIAANSPEWVLRDCEAKRRVLARHYAYGAFCDGCGFDSQGDYRYLLTQCPELADLAASLGVPE